MDLKNKKEYAQKSNDVNWIETFVKTIGVISDSISNVQDDIFHG